MPLLVHANFGLLPVTKGWVLLGLIFHDSQPTKIRFLISLDEQSVNLGSERNKIHPDSVRRHGQPGQQAGQRPQQAVQTGGRHAQVSCPLHQVDTTYHWSYHYKVTDA